MTPPHRVAIVQSNYIPWKGYFDLVNSVDEFVLYDDMQYTRRDWRNRNRIRTAAGLQWLTIPVEVKGRYHQRIRDTRISDPGWNERHWRTIAHEYARAPHFAEYAPQLESLYRRTESTWLSEVNHRFLTALCGILGIDTRLTCSSRYELVEGRTEKLAGICRQAGATEYLSGPNARQYMVPEVFESAGITLSYADYSGYPEYPQLHEPFEHGVSILDLLFNVGPDAHAFMKSFDNTTAFRRAA